MGMFDHLIPKPGTAAIASDASNTAMPLANPPASNMFQHLVPEPSFTGAMAKGFKRSLPETKSLLAGAGAAAAGAVGLDGVRDKLLDTYQGIQQNEVAPLQAKTGFIDAVTGDGSLKEWAGDTLGNFGGQALQSVAAAGAGALVGSAVPGAGTVAGGVGGLLFKAGAKEMVTDAVGRMVAKGVAKDVAEKTALRRLGGAAIAGTGLNVGQEIGTGYTGRAEDAKQSGEQLTQADALRAIGYGIPAGLVDTAAEALTGSRLMRGVSDSPKILSRMAKGAGIGAVSEGATEGVQAVLERAGAARGLTGEEAYRDYIENAAAGALGGGVAGAGGGFRRQQDPAAPPPPETPPPMTPEVNASQALPPASSPLATPPAGPLTRAAATVPGAAPLATPPADVTGATAQTPTDALPPLIADTAAQAVAAPPAADPVFEQAKQLLGEAGKVQRGKLAEKLGLNRNQMQTLLDQLHAAGIVGPSNGKKARKLLVNPITGDVLDPDEKARLDRKVQRDAEQKALEEAVRGGKPAAAIEAAAAAQGQQPAAAPTLTRLSQPPDPAAFEAKMREKQAAALTRAQRLDPAAGATSAAAAVAFDTGAAAIAEQQNAQAAQDQQAQAAVAAQAEADKAQQQQQKVAEKAAKEADKAARQAEKDRVQAEKTAPAQDVDIQAVVAAEIESGKPMDGMRMHALAKKLNVTPKRIDEMRMALAQAKKRGEPLAAPPAAAVQNLDPIAQGVQNVDTPRVAEPGKTIDQYDDSPDVTEDDITPPSGGAFSIRSAAEATAKRTPGGKVFEVDGGFVVRVPRAVVAQAATTAPDPAAAVYAAKDRDSYVSAVHALVQSLPDGSTVTDEDTGVTYAVKHSTNEKTGARYVEFGVVGGKGQNDVTFTTKADGSVKVSGDVYFPGKGKATIVPAAATVKESLTVAPAVTPAAVKAKGDDRPVLGNISVDTLTKAEEAVWEQVRTTPERATITLGELKRRAAQAATVRESLTVGTVAAENEQQERERADNEQQVAMPELSAHLESGQLPTINSEMADGKTVWTATAVKSTDKKHYLRLDPTKEERKAATVAESDIALADTQEEREAAKLALRQALLPATKRAVERAKAARAALTQAQPAAQETTNAKQEAPRTEQAAAEAKPEALLSEKPSGTMARQRMPRADAVAEVQRQLKVTKRRATEIVNEIRSEAKNLDGVTYNLKPGIVQTADVQAAIDRERAKAAAPVNPEAPLTVGDQATAAIPAAKRRLREARNRGDAKAEVEIERELQQLRAQVWDETPAAKTQEAPVAATTQPEKGIVGRRADGVMIREDERGVRWYAQGGARIFETVSMRPTRQGMQIDRGVLQREFMTAEESAAAAKDAAPTEQPKAKPAPSANTIFTDDAAAAAIARIKSKLGRVNSVGIDPEMIYDGIIVAGNVIEKGARKFTAYAAEMVEIFGDSIKPYLKSWYMGVKYDPRAAGFDGMDSAAIVESAVVDSTPEPEQDSVTEDSTDAAPKPTEPSVRGGDPKGVPVTEGRRERASQPGNAPPDTGDVASAQPEDVETTGASESGGSVGIRGSATDVEGKQESQGSGNARPGRKGAGGKKPPDAGAGRTDTAEPVGRTGDGAAGREGSDPRGPEPKDAESVSPANPGPGNFHIANPLEVVGGGQVARFNKNKAAIELFVALRDEGRRPTREEQEVLAGYTGWGSFGQDLFQGSWAYPQPKQGWEQRDQWLRDHLGRSDWEGLQRSITNAHYTDPPTVMAMWEMVRRMGFKGGRVLEPGMGIGNFFGMMPLDLKERSKLAGIELDPVTGGMAQMLYPDAAIKVMGYQDSKTPDDFYDLVIGNWPFENTPVADRRYNRLNPMLHDYFFLKTLDQVRPGGIVIGITSAGSMDKKGAVVRRELAKKAELIASFRLPSGAFEDYAGTKVVTDIIVLRKRPEPASNVDGEAWVDTVEMDTPAGEKVRVNAYYQKNPQNVVGTIDYGHGTTTFRPGLIVHRPENMQAQLDRIVSMVPDGAYLAATRPDAVSYIANHTSDREGALTRTDAGLFVVRGEHLAPAHEVFKYQVKSQKETAAREAQLNALIDMRKSYGQLIEAERGTSGAAPDPIRTQLRERYEAFVKAYGPLSESFGLGYLERIDDPFYYALAALETKEGKSYRPAAILSQSTIRSAKRITNPSIRDAFVLARNGNVNPSLEEIAKIAQKPEAIVRAELVDSGAVFETPGGDIVPSDMYLSGNVREKLRQAKVALADGNDAMQRNVAALEKVQPADIPYFNIEVQMGATWVPTRAYEQFVAHMLNRGDTDGISASYTMGRWKVTVDPGLQRSTEAQTGFGTRQYRFGKLVNAAISNQTVVIKERDRDGREFVNQAATDETNAKIADMREKFGDWLWSDAERRIEIEREYNEVRNAYASPSFDGSFLNFDGMALSVGRGPFDLRQHQVNAIWRALVMRRSLNAHEVGTGKTFTMGGIAVESRRYGIAKKPVLLAHNANSKSVASEIQMMYPAAKVLYIDNLSPKAIDVRLRQIANDDWDLIVLPHSLIERLSFREETLMAMAREEIEALEAEARLAAGDDGQNFTDAMLDDPDELKKLRSPTAKELVKARARIIETIKKQAQQSSREGAVPFEDLGIDMVLVDEAHEFKKPPIATRMKMKGLQTQSSLGSIQLSFLTRYVREQNNGGNVHLFTGTPITNTLTEIFHQMRYIMADEMAAVGVDQWDGWFGSFAKEVQDVELTAAGDYEAVNRLRGFINVPELRKMVGQYMDVVFSDDMPEMQPRRTASGKLLADQSLTERERSELLNGRTDGAKDRPYKKVVNETADPTPDQMRIFEEVQSLANEWRNMGGKARRDAMSAGLPVVPIVYEQLAARASFDARMENDEALAGKEGTVPDHPDSKVSRAIRNLLEIYRSDTRATQVVFTNTGLGTTANRALRDGAGGTIKDADGVTLRRQVKVFSPIRDMVERLVQQGVPRSEIEIVDGSTSKDKRKEIADAMNAGTVRIVIGSTQSLGVGVNMQRNLRAMHHLDAPWMPGDLEQRNGRGHRQGNQWNTVMEYRYITDRIDGRRWQVLAIKQKFITDFLKADGDTRVIEGDAASDEESDIISTFAEAAGDPRVLIRQKLVAQVEQLQKRERLHTEGVADAKRSARNAREALARQRAEIDRIEQSGAEQKAAKVVADHAGEKFSITVDGVEFSERKAANEAIGKFISANMRTGADPMRIGSYGGLPLHVAWPRFYEAPVFAAVVAGEEVATGAASVASLESSLRAYTGTVDKLRARIQPALETIQRLDEVAGQKFQRADQLKRAEQQLRNLEKDIQLNPVPPPAWLRNGAAIDTEVRWNGTAFVVTGHRWNGAGWFVIAQDAKGGEVVIPYLDAKDAQGMPLYEQREFKAPIVHAKKDEAPKDGTGPTLETVVQTNVSNAEPAPPGQPAAGIESTPARTVVGSRPYFRNFGGDVVHEPNAKKIELSEMPDGEFYIAPGLARDSGQFEIMEATTGLRVGLGKTRKAAIEAANKAIVENRATIKTALEQRAFPKDKLDAAIAKLDGGNRASFAKADKPTGTERQVIAAWRKLAGSDGFFQFKRSEGKSFTDILRDVAPGIAMISDDGDSATVEVRPTKGPEYDARVLELRALRKQEAAAFEKADALLTRRAPDAETAIDAANALKVEANTLYQALREYERPRAVTFTVEDGMLAMDASQLKAGVHRGSALYAVALNYAHNNGIVFVPDPAGVSDDAMIRRTEHMLSSALKFGTTRHMRPHEDQNIAWTVGDDAANLLALLQASSDNVLRNIPATATLDYDWDSLRFVNTATGERVGDADFQRAARTDVARAARAGVSTLRRAVVHRSMARRAGTREWPRLAARLLQLGRTGLRDSDLESLAYARGADGARGMTAEKLTRLLATAKQAMALLGVNIEVVANGSDLPAEITAQDDYDDTVQAAITGDRKTVYFVASRIASPRAAIKLVAHELVGHMSMEQLLGKRWPELRDAILRLRDNGKWPEVFAEVSKRYERNADGTFRPLDDATFAAEAIAVFAERNIQTSILQRAVNSVRAWLRRLGFAMDMSQGELRQMLWEAGQKLEGRAYRAAVVDDVLGAKVEPKQMSMREAVQRYSFGKDDETPELKAQFDATARAYGGEQAWQRAKDSGRTKLNYVQWVQVRTPAFKAWFGDWEATAHRAFLDGAPVSELTGDEFKPDGVPLTTKVPEWYAKQKVASVEVDGIGAVALDVQAVKNSMSHGIGRDKVAAFAAVPDVLRLGKIVHREQMRGSNVGMVYHVAAPISIGGQEFVADVLVKADENTRRMYVHEVAVKEKLQQSVFKTGAVAAEAGKLAGTDAGAIRSVLQGIYAVNPDTVSKVIDQTTGEPLAANFAKAQPAPDDKAAFAKAGTLVDRLGTQMNPHGDPSVLDWIKNRLSAMRPAALGALTLRMLGEVAEKILPSVARYSGVVQLMDTMRKELQELGQDVVKASMDYQAKNSAEAREMFSMLHDATLEGVDPSQRQVAEMPDGTLKFIDDATPKQIEKLKDAGATIKRGQFHEPLMMVSEDYKTNVPVTEASVKAFIKVMRKQMKLNPGSAVAYMNREKEARKLRAQERKRIKSHMDMVPRFNALSDDGKKLWGQMRDAYRTQSNKYLEALLSRIDSLNLDKSKKAEQIARMRMKFESSRVPFYVPLARWGNYWVSGTNDKGKREFYMQESPTAQDEVIRDLTARGFTKIGKGVKLDTVRAQDGASATFMADIDDMLVKSGAPDKIRDEAFQLYLAALPDLSMRKAFIHRKGTRGYSEDAPRALAAHIFHGSFQIARLRYSHELEALRVEAEKESKAMSDEAHEEAVAAGHIVNELKKRHEWVMNPQDNALLNKISSLGFVYYLGLTPASALVNLLATPMVALPILAATGNWASASKHLWRAFKESAGSYGHMEKVLTNEDEIAAHKEFERRGVLDRSQVHNLAGIAESDSFAYSPKWHKTMTIISHMFHKAEVVNREATTMASYRMQREAGIGHEEAMNLAEQQTYEAHLDYSNANRARFMQSGTAKVLLMFRQYSLGMTWLIGRNLWKSDLLGGALGGKTDKAELREARRKVAGILGMTAIFSGTLGLPIIGTVGAVLNAVAAAFGDDDEPWDWETEFRAFLREMLGETGAEAVLRGPVQAATGVGISNRVSMGDLWFREPDRELEGRAWSNYLFEQAAGPMGGLITNFFRGQQLMGEGQVWRGVETMMPKAIKDAMKSLRYLDEGVNNLRGDAIVEDLNVFESLAQIAGFAPASVANAYDTARDVKNYEQAILNRRARLMDAFALAWRLGDVEAREAVLGKMRKFSQTYPELAITGDSIRRSLMQRAKASAQADNGVIVDKRIRARLEGQLGLAQ